MRIAAVAQEDVDGRPIEHMKVQALVVLLSLGVFSEADWPGEVRQQVALAARGVGIFPLMA